ncbi:hypothetical protein [Cellulosimicrobium phage DS1]|nr:hypothetical protein [Cellulosimicrobium phage DS1]
MATARQNGANYAKVRQALRNMDDFSHKSMHGGWSAAFRLPKPNAYDGQTGVKFYHVYSYETLIAVYFVFDNVMFEITDRAKYSVTTSKQQGMLWETGARYWARDNAESTHNGGFVFPVTIGDDNFKWFVRDIKDLIQKGITSANLKTFIRDHERAYTFRDHMAHEAGYCYIGSMNYLGA